ncbi:putative cardiolipin synthase [Eufriesea mexicana]|uniref:probable cardiolipin synthase (CMP-forming) n=1 Tax=Eufriesea mexicana TaxID=516756 RepID=UPI00083C084D|nr:PREDICTED: probable cardiolipin synthase (CMP-forming) [Eufriesea mexicana]OAD56812.1 putative cardiolipin synthase [Eufriesea mexicana]
MSHFMILYFKQSTILNRYWLKKCLRQCFIYHARVYSTGIGKHHKNYITKRENVARRKSLRLQVLRGIKQTKQKVGGIIEKENIWTIPNFLCIGRILTSPYLSYSILSQDYRIALYVLIIAGCSDLADGWIARTWISQASKLGSFLDPVADKLLVGTLFLSLAWVGLVPTPLTCLVIARDVALISAASYIRYKSLPFPKTLGRYFDPTYATAQLAPTYISKINTVIQLSFIAGTLAAPVFHFVNHPILEVLCYITALTTLAGGISYLTSKNTYKLFRKKSSTKSSH